MRPLILETNFESLKVKEVKIGAVSQRFDWERKLPKMTASLIRGHLRIDNCLFLNQKSLLALDSIQIRAFPTLHNTNKKECSSAPYMNNHKKKMTTANPTYQNAKETIHFYHRRELINWTTQTLVFQLLEHPLLALTRTIGLRRTICNKQLVETNRENSLMTAGQSPTKDRQRTKTIDLSTWNLTINSSFQ
jgi:hypothetical protein